jgi:hypothetical protein
MNKLTITHTCILAALGYLTLPIAFADSNLESAVVVAQEVKHDTSRPLSDALPARKFAWTNQDQLQIPLFYPPFADNQTPFAQDTVLQSKAWQQRLMLNVSGFAGLGIGLGSYTPRAVPPDPVGTVGPNHFAEWVNVDFAVFDKAGKLLAGFPKSGNAVWAGFGGYCETTNRGDPMVKYDQLADRWVLSQFAYTNSSTGPFFQCIAVSTSSDPTGSYYRYAFQYDSFNDYGKLGLWPNAYFMTFNMFGPVSTGPRVCAYDRQAMLAGRTATSQCKQLTFSDSGTLLPVDLDGKTLPPAGSPGYFMSFTYNALKVFKYTVDFVNPANTKFEAASSIPIAAFTRPCNGSNGCIPQPNTAVRLDTLSDRLMYRLAYRQFPTYGAMVTNHVVQGTSAAGIRWYEIRVNNDGAFTPTLFQQGTFAPDSNNRFMGSIAMDKNGNIAAGYTVSSNSAFPSIAVATRTPTDPAGTLGNETMAVSGTASQITYTRWGDYTNMAIDPKDDCTFWYTGEYMKNSGSVSWSTYIAKFSMPNCTADGGGDGSGRRIPI